MADWVETQERLTTKAGNASPGMTGTEKTIVEILEGKK